MCGKQMKIKLIGYNLVPLLGAIAPVMAPLTADITWCYWSSLEMAFNKRTAAINRVACSWRHLVSVPSQFTQKGIDLEGRDDLSSTDLLRRLLAHRLYRWGHAEIETGLGTFSDHTRHEENGRPQPLSGLTHGDGVSIK